MVLIGGGVDSNIFIRFGLNCDVKEAINVYVYIYHSRVCRHWGALCRLLNAVVSSIFCVFGLFGVCVYGNPGEGG